MEIRADVINLWSTEKILLNFSYFWISQKLEYGNHLQEAVACMMNRLKSDMCER
jgi:hypothetical protein